MNGTKVKKVRYKILESLNGRGDKVLVPVFSFVCRDSFLENSRSSFSVRIETKKFLRNSVFEQHLLGKLNSDLKKLYM